MTERREHLRTPGRLKEAEDAAYTAIRHYDLHPAEPEAKCLRCMAPLEEGHECVSCA